MMKPSKVIFSLAPKHAKATPASRQAAGTPPSAYRGIAAVYVCCSRSTAVGPAHAAKNQSQRRRRLPVNKCHRRRQPAKTAASAKTARANMIDQRGVAQSPWLSEEKNCKNCSINADIL